MRSAAMTDATVMDLRPSPEKGEETPRRKAKDVTAAERSKRYRGRKRRVTPAVTLPPSITPKNAKQSKAVTLIAGDHLHAIDVTAYVAAIALAGAAAWFSIRGMVVLFPGSPLSVIGMSVAMEAAKLVTAGWLARRWRATEWVWRGRPIALVTGRSATKCVSEVIPPFAAPLRVCGRGQTAIPRYKTHRA